MAQYVPRSPEGIQFKPEYNDFFSTFYAISDTPDAHQQYSQQFTRDATLIMASKKAQGTDGLRSPLMGSLPVPPTLIAVFAS